MSANPAPSTPAVVTIICGIWNDGYHVVKQFLTQDEVSAVRRAVDSLPEAKWFRETGGAHRRQATLSLADNINATPPAFHFVHERVVDFAGRLHHSWTVTTKWDAVELSPGCPPQRLHRDFASTETAAAIEAHEWVQASVLLALTDGPKLITVPEAFNGCAIRSNAYVIDMNAGDLLIFRGDLPHADPRPEARDVRLQGTLLVDNVAHDGTVERVAWGVLPLPLLLQAN